MASIKQLDERRYKITVSNGYRPNGKKISKAKTIQVPPGVPKRGIGQYVAHAAEELERSFKTGYAEDGEMTFEEFASRWLKRQTKYAPSTIAAYRRMLEVVYPMIGGIRLSKLRPMALENMLSELRAERFRNFYAELRKVIRPDTKKPLSEYTIEGVHATLCSILSDAVEGGFLSHNPAWRTYRYAGRKCEKKIADEETAQRIIAALEGESIKYETYFKLIIATGMRRGECCGLKWCDIDWEQRSIHICRNAVKVTDEDTLNCKVEIRFLIIFNVSPYCLFPDDENRKFSVYYMELAPGSHWQSEPHLRGTTEFVTLFAGAIEITADQKTIVVQASESVRFQGDTTHAYRNISDQTTILHMILYNP